jgi:hypothetical protein
MCPSFRIGKCMLLTNRKSLFLYSFFNILQVFTEHVVIIIIKHTLKAVLLLLKTYQIAERTGQYQLNL